MRRIMLTLVAIAVVIALDGCTRVDANLDPKTVFGSGHVVEETRDVAPFTKVELIGFGTLHVTQGTAPSLTVSADDNLMPLVRSVVADGILTIRVEKADPRLLLSPTKLDFSATVVSLDQITVSDYGRVVVDGLQGKALRVDVAGAAAVAMTGLDLTALKATLSGGGSLSAAGKASSQDVSILGTGDYVGGRLASRKAKVKSDGAGRATVRVSDSLGATITGAGRIDYLGDPKLTQTVTGPGAVKRIAEPAATPAASPSARVSSRVDFELL